MEEGMYTIPEARDYLGVYEKILYTALKNGDLQGRKSRRPGGKWLLTKEDLDTYKGRIERGEVETRFPLAGQPKKKDEKTYTIKEAAQLIGVGAHVVYGAKDCGLIPARKDANGGYFLTEEDIERVRKSRDATLKSTTEGAPVEVKPVELPLPAKVERPQQARPNDSALLQNILTSTFAFLAEHSFSIGIQSLEEVEATFRHWLVKTPDTTLDIVATGEQITVLAERYQKELEAKLASLTEQLRKAETTLGLLRQKKREVLLPYAYDLPVWIEQRHESVLVWCDLFPFSAFGKDEQEAIAAFKFTLKGYTRELHIHEKELKPDKKAQFETLKELLVEDDYS
jgi:hypothetical protein